MLECVVVCEADADRRAAVCLAERMLEHAVPWAQGVLPNLVSWRGLGEAEPFLPIKSIKDRATRAGFRVHGRFEGQKGEYLQVRKACSLVERAVPGAAVLFVRDDDGKGLRADIEAGRAEKAAPLTLVLGVPVPELEAWYLVGFEPRDPKEQERLDEVCRELGGHPCAVAHALNPKRETHRRSTKRVLAALTGDDVDRQAACLAEPPLERLVAQGNAVGLTAFLDEIRTLLAPRLRSA